MALVDFIESRLRKVNDQPFEGGKRIARLREVDCGGNNYQAIELTLRGRGVDIMEGFSITNCLSF